MREGLALQVRGLGRVFRNGPNAVEALRGVDLDVRPGRPAAAAA